MNIIIASIIADLLTEDKYLSYNLSVYYNITTSDPFITEQILMWSQQFLGRRSKFWDIDVLYITHLYNSQHFHLHLKASQCWKYLSSNGISDT